MASRNNLSTKIILMVEAILLISSILFCTVSIYRAKVGIRKAIQQRMLDIANCASGSLSGDTLKALTKDNIGGPEYEKVYETLTVFRDNAELEYVYCIKEESPGEFVFTVDSDPVSPGGFGESVEYTDALASAGKGTAAVDEVPYSDSWGSFYSAYSPVFDSSGEVVGIVAVDFSAEWFDDQLSTQTRTTIISYIVILVFSLLVAAVLALLTVRPFVHMQSKLFEEKVRAESANNAKSDFLANMSHEIRTPINAVLGMNEMIIRENHKAQELEGSDSEGVQETLSNIGVYAEDVKNAGHNLLAIVNDILDFSKIEAGRMDIVEAPYQLSSLLNDLNNMIYFKTQEKKLDFNMDVDPKLPEDILGDEVRVRQVFTNLLNNAVKYTEQGSVSLTIRGERFDGDKINIIAVVKDTGIGIKPEDKEKLFNKFQRLEMERNSTVEGTGLGLVITQKLLEIMGGTISAESEYGKGSTFTVTFPQKILTDYEVGDFQAHFEENLKKAKKYKESFTAENARILIVDDTRINLTVIKNLLKNTKMQIDTAASGVEAVEKAEKAQYDLIFMDQRMPEMDGTEAFHKIRESESEINKYTPVICLTADAVIGAKERYLAEGFSDYLTKPVDSFALEKMLVKYLPKDKVELIEEKKSESVVENSEKEYSDKLTSMINGSEESEDKFAALRDAGFDVETGLMYSQNEEEFYLEILKEYASGLTEKTELIQKYYEAEDWKNYTIYVHALKSTSKMIGVMDLSEQAAKLEAAGNAEDADTIREGHDSMLVRYAEVAAAITSMLPEEEGEKEESSEDIFGEGEIFEFFPEDDQDNK